MLPAIVITGNVGQVISNSCLFWKTLGALQKNRTVPILQGGIPELSEGGWKPTPCRLWGPELGYQPVSSRAGSQPGLWNPWSYTLFTWLPLVNCRKWSCLGSQPRLLRAYRAQMGSNGPLMPHFTLAWDTSDPGETHIESEPRLEGAGLLLLQSHTICVDIIGLS
jgi:hypothetical protein